MLRKGTLEEISDGKLYEENDMVRADCHGCAGCSSCCQGMGESIVLDPLDVFHLTVGLSLSFEQLLAGRIELHIVDAVILPSLTMAGKNQACTFLDGKGRCSVHLHRPGVCRIFPLGRYWEGDDFRYILQTEECRRKNRTKVKVKKWIDTERLRENRAFLIAWHSYLKELRSSSYEVPIKETGTEPEGVSRMDREEAFKKRNLHMLQVFYAKPYDKNRDFYEQFNERMEVIKAERQKINAV